MTLAEQIAAAAAGTSTTASTVQAVPTESVRTKSRSGK